MTKYTGNVAIGLLITLMSLGAPACSDKQNAANLKDPPDLNQQIYPYVTVERTKLRSGPGSQFRTIAEVGANAKINAVGRDGDWLLIVSKKGNAPGFIELAAVKAADGAAKETLNPSADGKYESTAETSVRRGPGRKYPAVATIPKGTKLNVVDEEDGWLKVESKQGNKPGYVEASFARPVKN